MIKAGYLRDRQITPNNFVDKGVNLSANTSQNFSLVCMRLLPPQDQLLIFCRLLHVVQLIFVWQNNKISGLCQNLPWSKTARLC